jgi:hypothetical protein
MTNIEFICNLCSINTGYHMPIVSALGRLRQEDGKFKKKKKWMSSRAYDSTWLLKDFSWQC